LCGDNIDTAQYNIPIIISEAQALLDEGFDTWLPQDWSIDSNEANWSQSVSGYAGGSLPEAMMTWSPQFDGTSRLISSPLRLMGAADVSVTFSYSVDHFDGNGYTLALDVRSNGSAWERIWSVPAGVQPATTVTLPVTTALLNQPDFQFGWCFDGSSWDINYWYIDDISLTATLGSAPSITGRLTLVDGEMQAGQSLVTLGGYSTHPDTLGLYTLLASRRLRRPHRFCRSLHHFFVQRHQPCIRPGAGGLRLRAALAATGRLAATGHRRRDERGDAELGLCSRLHHHAQA
jgi:hypothetical protein